MGSADWAAINRPAFMDDAIGAVGKAITDHQAEQAEHQEKEAAVAAD